MSKVFASAHNPQKTEAKTEPNANCIEVRLNMSTKKVRPKETKANGWRHVANVASGPVSYNEITGKVLLSIKLFTEDGNNPVPVWGFEPVIEKKAMNLLGVNLDSYSNEELIEAGAAHITGWEKIPLTWEALTGLQEHLTGAPGLQVVFTLELEGSIVGQLEAAQWSGVSIVLTLDLSNARVGKVKTFATRVYREVNAECIDARIDKTLPMGTPVKGVVQALETAKAISKQGDDEEEDDLFFKETQYLAAFGQVGEPLKKPKAWKRHVGMLSSENPNVKALAVFCLGQLLARGALKSGNAASLEKQYGVEITPVEGLPPTAPASQETVETEVVNFDGVEL